MPSPDVSSYVDLTLFDLSSQQIFLDAVQYARIALPEFQPTEGSIETTLLEAMALEVQDLVTSINRLPGGILQALLGFLGIPRIDANASTGLIKVIGNQSVSATIPAGIRFYARTTPTSAPVPLFTTAAVALTRNRQISTLTRASNIAIVTTVTHHGLANGQVITMVIDPAGTGDTSFDGEFTITVSDETTFTYPNTAGNVAETDVADTSTYAQVADTVNPYGFVEISASVPGYSYFPLATNLTLITSIPQIASASLATTIDGGYDAESDADFFQRASSSLNRMTSSLVTSDQISQYIASRPEFLYVHRINTVDNCNDSRQTETPGAALTVVARIGSTNDLQIQPSELTAISDAISPYAHPALEIFTDNAFLCEIDITASVVAVEGISAGQVETAIQSALTSYISPDTWNWSDVIRKNELIHVIRMATYNGIPAVAYVNSVQIVPTDLNFEDFVPSTLDTFTAVRASDELTVTPDGIPFPSFDSSVYSYVALRETGETYALYEVTGISGSDFTINQTGDDDGSVTGDWFLVAENYLDIGDASPDSGNLSFWDPSPLVKSGTHTLTIL